MEAIIILLVLTILVVIPILSLILIIRLFRRSSETLQQCQRIENRLNKFQVAQTPTSPVKKTPKPVTVKPVTMAFTTPTQPLTKSTIEKIIEPTVEKTVKVKVPKKPSKVREIFSNIKEWILVGDRYRAVGVSKEYAIASNWLARIGIITLVLGIGFGLRYSYKHGLVPPEARVVITSILGVIMTTVGLKLNGKKYELLGHGLLGGGITTLYFTVFSSTNLYELIPPTVGFAAMTVITATCGVISVKFNSKLVAILGIIGGYGTPIFLSTGSHNLIGLYSYFLLLGVGVLGITTKRNWYMIRALSFVLNWGIVIASLYIDKSYLGHGPQFTSKIIFLVLFFLLFSFNTCCYQVLKKLKSTILEVVGLFINSAIFAALAIDLIDQNYSNPKYAAFVTIGLAMFYIICSNLVLQRKNSDRNLVLTFIGLSGFFTALSLPILLSAGWLTVSWSLQALLMLWLSRKLNNRFLQSLAYLLYLITFISLVSTFNNLYSERIDLVEFSDRIALLWNHLVQVGIPVISFYFAKRLLINEITPSGLATDSGNDIPPKWLPNQELSTGVLQAVVVVFFFLFSIIEVERITEKVYEAILAPARSVVFICLIFYLIWQLKSQASKTVTIVLYVVVSALTLKVLCIDLGDIWNLNSSFTYGLLRNSNIPRYYVEQGAMRFINFMLLTTILLTFLKFISSDLETKPALIKAYGFITLFTPFLFLTLEVNSVLAYHLPKFQAGGVSIVWGCYAIGMLSYGIIKSQVYLRLTALVLIAITVLKVFAYDLKSLGDLWRIVAFVVLGCLIFLGSFIYIRFQHLFTTATLEDLNEK